MPQTPGIRCFCGTMCHGSMWLSWCLLPTIPLQQEIMKYPKTQALDTSVKITQLLKLTGLISTHSVVGSAQHGRTDRRSVWALGSAQHGPVAPEGWSVWVRAGARKRPHEENRPTTVGLLMPAPQVGDAPAPGWGAEGAVRPAPQVGDAPAPWGGQRVRSGLCPLCMAGTGCLSPVPGSCLT